MWEIFLPFSKHLVRLIEMGSRVALNGLSSIRFFHFPPISSKLRIF